MGFGWSWFVKRLRRGVVPAGQWAVPSDQARCYRVRITHFNPVFPAHSDDLGSEQEEAGVGQAGGQLSDHLCPAGLRIHADDLVEELVGVAAKHDEPAA